MEISTEKLYRLCNKYQWFTSGDCTQYEKLFKKNRQGASLETLATIIWLCSVGYTRLQVWLVVFPLPSYPFFTSFFELLACILQVKLASFLRL